MNLLSLFAIVAAAFMIGWPLLSKGNVSVHEKFSKGYVSVHEAKLIEPRLSTNDTEDAVCYAQRYQDLFSQFCGGILTECLTEDLFDHFEETGRAEGRVWGCLPGMEVEAICYAKRYPDLFRGYCNNDEKHCNALGLYIHYRDHGSSARMVWHCRDTKTTLTTTYSLLPALTFLNEMASGPKISKLHVIVFDTDINVLKEVPVVKQIADDRLSSWLTYATIGTDIGFKGFSTKWVSVAQYLETQSFEGGTYIVVVDARDTLLNLLPRRQVSSESILERLSETVQSVTNGNHGAVIMSAEGQCCVAALTYVEPGDYFHPDGKRNIRACSSGEEGCSWNGDSEKIAWEDAMIRRSREVSSEELGVVDAFLNAGLVAGFPESLSSLLNLANFEPSEDDQAVFTDIFLSHPNLIVLDYYQEIFGNARWTKALDNGGCPFQQGIFTDGLYHQETLFTPLMLHTPGKYWECYDALQISLGLQPTSFHHGSIQERNLRRSLQYGSRINIVCVINISPVDLPQPTAQDISVLKSACERFFTTLFSTSVTCTPIVTPVPPSVGRKLQVSSYQVRYIVDLIGTTTLTQSNAEQLVMSSLTTNEATLIDLIVDEAVATQGTSSSLDKVTDAAVIDVILASNAPSSAPSELPSSKPDKPDCRGLTAIFCIIGEAFGGFANFLKWVIKILTFGLIS